MKNLLLDVAISCLSLIYALRLMVFDENPLLWKLFGWRLSSEGTPADLMGPEYKLLAPARTHSLLDDPSNKNKRPILTFSGRITDLNGQPLVPPPKLNIWHPDNEGHYSFIGYDCRGIVTCSDEGYFKFETAVPRYISLASVIGQDWLLKEKPGTNTRPAHFHVIITHKGKQLLCTQIYFENNYDVVKNMYGFPTCTPKQMAKVVTHEPDSTHSTTYYTSSFDFFVNVDGKLKSQ